MKQSGNEYYYSLIEELIESITIEHHAVYGHANMDDEILKTRSSIEHLDASCFNGNSEETIEIITDVVYEDINLLAWMKSNVREDYIINVRKEGCGRKFLHKGSHNWQNGAIVCNNVRVILGKRFDVSGALTALYLITAYPY